LDDASQRALGNLTWVRADHVELRSSQQRNAVGDPVRGDNDVGVDEDKYVASRNTS
jgi:hypothetical protein